MNTHRRHRHDDGSDMTSPGLGGAAAARARPATPAALDHTTRTRTLRGIGPSHPPVDACPACHVKGDEPIDPAIAVAFGIARVFIHGADATKAQLCPQHKSMVNLLVHEMRSAGSSDD